MCSRRDYSLGLTSDFMQLALSHHVLAVRRASSDDAAPLPAPHETTRALTACARRGRAQYEVIAIRGRTPIDHAISHRHLVCVGWVSTRGRSRRSHDPPPASPMHVQPHASSETPPSSGRIYVTSLRNPIALHARQQAAYRNEHAPLACPLGNLGSIEHSRTTSAVQPSLSILALGFPTIATATISCPRAALIANRARSAGS